MAIAIRNGQDVRPDYTVFGKVPRSADFIRVNAALPVVQEFDALIGESLLHSGDAEGAASGSACAFQYVARDERSLLLGVMRHSRDSAGRRYPIVAGLVLPTGGFIGREAALPIAREVLLTRLQQELAAAIEASAELLSCRRVLERELAALARLDDDLNLAEAVLARHQSATAAATLQTALTDCGNAGLEAHLLAFVLRVRMLGQYAGHQGREGFSLPLPSGDGESWLALANWLSLYGALAPVQAVSASWVSVENTGRRALVLAPQGLSARMLASAWGAQSDAILDLQAACPPWFQRQSYAEAAYVLGRQIADPALSIHALRDVLVQLQRGLS